MQSLFVHSSFFRVVFLLIILISVSSTAHSQNLPYVHKVVKDFGMPTMFGRSLFKSGDSIAADYIQKEFAKFKLAPVIGNSYYQTLSIKNVVLEDVSLELDSKGNVLRPDDDYYVAGFSPTTNLELVNEKTILVSDPNHWNLLKGTRLSDVTLVFNIKTFAAELRNIKAFIDTSLTNIIPKLMIIQGYEKLSFHIGKDELSLFPVIQFRGEPISQTINYLKLGIKSHLKDNHQTANVIGMVEGRNKNKYVLITSHFDSQGMFGDKVFHGAQDNASGVAAMLDLAEHFSKTANKPPYSVLFVSFAAEEIGRLGSKYFVQNPPVPLENIEIVLNLDLVGSGAAGLQLWNGNATNTRKVFADFEKINQKEYYFYKLVAADDRCISDHCSFVEANIPALFLMTLGEEHKWSHSIYDNYENLPFTKYESLFRIIRDYVSNIK